MTLTTLTSAGLLSAGLDPDAIVRLLRDALSEDLAGGLDATTAATVPPAQRSTGDVVARHAGVVAGLPIVTALLEVTGSRAIIDSRAITDSRAIVLTPRLADGDRVAAGGLVAVLEGNTRELLTAERTLLNILGWLSGIATLTRRWVDAVEGTGAVIRDTRKTHPGLRALEKYAVRCGGGTNHRMSLSEVALIKDNHVVAAGGITAAFAAVRARFPALPVEVEVDDLAGLREALAAGADLVLLDNLPPETLAEAVRINGGRACLEASGGLTLANARAVAETGVTYLAVGALTHSAPVLDLGLDLRTGRMGQTAPPAR